MLDSDGSYGADRGGGRVETHLEIFPCEYIVVAFVFIRPSKPEVPYIDPGVCHFTDTPC